MGISHFSLDLRPGNQSRHRVDHQHVESTRADQHVGNFQSLFTGIRLGDQQFVHIHSQDRGIGGIEAVFGVHEGRYPPVALRFGHHMESKGGFSRALRTIYLNHPPPRHAPYPQGHVQGQGGRWRSPPVSRGQPRPFS